MDYNLGMPDIYKSEAIPVRTNVNSGGDARNVDASEIIRRCGEVRGKKMWGAYTVGPKSKFVQEQEDEEVVLLLRSHPVTNVKWVIVVIVFLVLPELLNIIGIFSQVPGRVYVLGKMFLYLVLLGYAFEKFLYWYYTVVIVTNERIIDIDFVNLLHRVVTYAGLNHIEEPSMVSGGLMRSIFHYGDVKVATAAETEDIEALAVPYPDKVIRIISELSEELEKRRERGD